MRQWEDMWADLDSLTSGQTHYMGNLVMSQTKIKETAPNVHAMPATIIDIIDGQQRLTTLFLLAFALFEV